MQKIPLPPKSLLSIWKGRYAVSPRWGVTGAPRGYVSEKLHAFPYRDRCFYFRIVENHLIVVRVLHGRQDISAELFKD
jgi:toxin ParE1/3/4